MTSVSTCLSSWPLKVKGCKEERTLLLWVSEHVCVVCFSWWGPGGERWQELRGTEVPGNTLPWCLDACPDTHGESVTERKPQRDEAKEPQKKKSVILMVTFMAWESWVAARLPHHWPQSSRHQTDASVCELFCHQANDRCIFQTHRRGLHLSDYWVGLREVSLWQKGHKGTSSPLLIFSAVRSRTCQGTEDLEEMVIQSELEKVLFFEGAF